MGKSNIRNPILQKWTRNDIANKLQVSYQTVVNWFDDNHPSSMPVKYLQPLGFGIIGSDVFGKTLEELLVYLPEDRDGE